MTQFIRVTGNEDGTSIVLNKDFIMSFMAMRRGHLD